MCFLLEFVEVILRFRDYGIRGFEIRDFEVLRFRDFELIGVILTKIDVILLKT